MKDLAFVPAKVHVFGQTFEIKAERLLAKKSGNVWYACQQQITFTGSDGAQYRANLNVSLNGIKKADAVSEALRGMKANDLRDVLSLVAEQNPAILELLGALKTA